MVLRAYEVTMLKKQILEFALKILERNFSNSYGSGCHTQNES